MAVGTTQKLKGLGGKFAKSPDMWHIKFRRVPYIVEYRMPGTPSVVVDGALEPGHFIITYDAGNTNQAVNTFRSSVYTRGQVGFWWDRT